MEFRKVCAGELEAVQHIYRAICQRMHENKIQIWDEIYPCQYLAEDLASDRLYMLMEQGEILSALALCPASEGVERVKWMEDTDNVMYLNRLGVNVAHAKRGIGSLMLDKAKAQAKKLGARYLRLFVVDFNTPAVRLYEKNGFARAQGRYDMTLEDGRVLRQYGYEVRL